MDAPFRFVRSRPSSALNRQWAPPSLFLRSFLSPAHTPDPNRRAAASISDSKPTRNRAIDQAYSDSTTNQTIHQPVYKYTRPVRHLHLLGVVPLVRSPSSWRVDPLHLSAAMSSPSSGRGRKRDNLEMDAAGAPPASSYGQSFTMVIDGQTYIVSGSQPPPSDYDEDFFRGPTVPVVEEHLPRFLATLDVSRLPPFLRSEAATWRRQEVHDEDSNFGHKRARVPASSKAILGLKEVSAGDAGMQAECAVCLQDFDAEDKLRAMPCSHAFHQQCIFGWLRVNHVCPLCRHALPTLQPGEDDHQG